jgi:hypothetical protein
MVGSGEGVREGVSAERKRWGGNPKESGERAERTGVRYADILHDLPKQHWKSIGNNCSSVEVQNVEIVSRLPLKVQFKSVYPIYVPYPCFRL